jgi:4-hydroxy-tetrahydrodipicolinate synthase
VLGTILTAAVTPFDADLQVDEPAAAELLAHLVEHGSDGVVMAGTTGEASTLTDDEKVALYRLAVREVGGRASVVAGTGSNDTAHSVHLTRLAAEAGVDAVLVVTPYYNRPPRAGIVAHVASIAEVGVPVVLYNIPGRTTVNMEPDLIAELGEIPNVTAVKQANPDLGECRVVAETSGLDLYAGNDDMLLPVAQMGGAGVISVASHLAGPQMAAVVEAVRRGEQSHPDQGRSGDDRPDPLGAAAAAAGRGDARAARDPSQRARAPGHPLAGIGPGSDILL